MPEQPQWPERTLNMPPQDPWAEPPTAPVSPSPFGSDADPTKPDMQETARHPQSAHAGAPRSTAAQDATRVGAPQSPAPQGAARASVPQSPAPQGAAGADRSPFSRGRAQVSPRAPQHEEHTSTAEWHGEPERPEQPPRSLDWHIQRLRRGGEWTSAALLFSFVCWGLWALASGEGLANAFIVYVVSLVVAAGVFALSRLVGRVVLERQMGRQRNTARGSHLVTALFLVGVGVAFLRQTAWVVTAYTWIAGLF
ncbi:DNA-directed RNA polymerase II [Actinoplanes sp. NBRC 101535]|uniref:DNA-directed RNA polymerase II n=1 Tax=Actinoplanes sp. NBRC 101535 TaxID=3032196 RepID=UPI00249FE0AA|nr:DNA-directed RNA polymerase II [Actinoplanes sp. NBRC 101535]GLY01439.1 hypothetical protein Acsp01_18180 [Actinoplanes sp. NBRC 101535]